MHVSDEGIVAASVEENEPQLGRSRHGTLNAIECDGLVVDLAIAGKLSVNRNKIVPAAHLQTMPCKIDESPITSVGIAFEFYAVTPPSALSWRR